jgi:hypothetical protein
MADNRIVTGVAIALSLEALHTFQLLLPPLYGEEKATPEHIQKAVQFNGIYILIIATAAGIVTRNPAPILLPAITLAVAYYLYSQNHGSDAMNVINDEGEDDE